MRALILGSLVLPVALLSAVAYRDWTQLHDAAEQRARKTAIILREHALKVLETHELILDRLDDYTSGMTWDEITSSEDLSRKLSVIVRGHEQVSSLLFVSPDGQLAHTSRQFPIPDPVNAADREYFRVHLESPSAGTFIGEPVIGRVSGEPIINVSRRLNSREGDFNGVAASAVFLNYFNQFYLSLSEQGGDSVTLAREDGTVLIREPPIDTGVDRLSPSSGLMRSTADANTGFYETVSELDGIRRLHAHEKVGDYPIFVSYGVSLSSVWQEWLAHLRNQGIFAALASVGLAAVGGIALRQARREESAVDQWREEAIERERAERLYRGLYNKAPIPQQSLDADGNILNVSDTWLHLLGYERGSVIGRRFRDVVLPDHHDTFEENWARLMAGGTLKDVPLDVVRRSGERIPVLWSASVEVDQEEIFVKTYGALVDVTERRRAEKALAHLQKMEAIGQLVAGVGHDFNNLLQALSGCLQMLDKRISEPRSKVILEAGQQAIDRGAKLTQQLMGFARKEALQPEPMSVPDQVLAMSELLVRALRENIKFDVDFEKPLWSVLVDPTQFEVALLNLTINARDAMPDGGTLRIIGRNCTFKPGEREDVVAGEFVRISVQDTGTGMPPEVMDRVFDPFFTTKAVGRGSGLGLSQVYGFARQSGGSAGIESELGLGTSIDLLLPRSKDLPVGARRADRAHGTIKGISVLLVEDDPLVATMVGAALEDLGCAVLRAGKGEEALQTLQSDTHFDLLFSDIVMPGGMDGLELANKARALRPELGIVLTTGYSENRAHSAGIPVLAKPYRMEKLAETLLEEVVRLRRRSEGRVS